MLVADEDSRSRAFSPRPQLTRTKARRHRQATRCRKRHTEDRGLRAGIRVGHRSTVSVIALRQGPAKDLGSRLADRA